MAQGASHLIIWGEFSLMGKTRIDIRVTEVATSKILESKGFSGTDETARSQANVYLQQLQEKYPNSKVKKD